MSDQTILQVLRQQALQRAIGEMNAALETMLKDNNGEYPALAEILQDCIKTLKDNM
ncbi:hypothetical protein QDQ39_00815 [Providencia rettgeri]|uniref:hypothetical protein n=1 Tax=Providencia rettgeri TaxID=587 RepID=UPI002447A503|nr:hypothetical protein [Providencia rettgeri]MDH2394346.1 hypothetical protein [Providencia rettgeri]